MITTTLSKTLLVLGVVERREPVGGQAIVLRLARAGRVLDEVRVTGSVRAGVGLELQHGVPLVVAGEDHALSRSPSGDRSLRGPLDVDEAVQDVEPGVLAPDPLPQVARSCGRSGSADCPSRGRGRG